ncbi:ABC transporter ATP-binding protein [Hippea alviniae]|uniref:oligopeptide/dipeptide ABC transporter ATP-binding protein n=1 Tax=Hippea alviniae TaxID=1279027 RepID=UPI0003B6122D|nr:ABC transporter ATP-binding protein [Hippea alviniae]
MVCNINIEEAYYDDKKVLEDIRLNVKKGDVWAIVGESGAGKTTLARIISGMWRFYPLRFEGEVSIDEDTGLIPQNITDSLDPLFKIREQLLEIESDLDKIKETLRKVGFEDVEYVLDSYPHNLSGGMRQRVLIAAALLKSKIILADEFTSALDSMTKMKVVNLLKELNRTDNITLIFITHDVEMLAFDGKLVVLFDGKIVEMGSIEEIKLAPTHPYTRFLFGSVPKIDMHYKDFRFSEIEAKREYACPFYLNCPKAEEKCKTEQPPLKERNDRFVRCHF